MMRYIWKYFMALVLMLSITVFPVVNHVFIINPLAAEFNASDYPSTLSSKREKVFEIITRYKSSDSVYLVEKGGKLQESLKYSDYTYYGDMKKNRPHGFGMVFGEEYCFVGEFKDGKPSGYGILFNATETHNDDEKITYEGPKCSLSSFLGSVKFHVSGKGVGYLNEYRDFNKPRVLYEGGLKDNMVDGKGKLYFIPDEYTESGKLYYEGSFKEGDFSGKGTMYYEDGTVKYKGEFKNSKFHGSGTLYNPDGSVKYKGKFKNGDIAN